MSDNRPLCGDTAALSADSGSAARGASGCPLAHIPASAWQGLLRPPLRKRRPLLFWGGVLLALTVLGGLALGSGDESFVSGPRIALVSVNGPILKAEPVLDWIRKVERNPAVKGVLVRVDSPGGGAAASQEIHDAIAALAQKMPVAVSMGGMAASGGLMVSVAGTRVFANPSTVTGSIGVRMDIPQVRGLLDKVGVGQETLTTAPYKDAGSWLHPLTREQREYFAAVLGDMHQQFVDIVARGRRMERAQAAQLADGRIFTGREALKAGLVDEMGGQAAALDWLAGESGVPAGRRLLVRPKEGDWLSRALKVWLGVDLDGLGALAGRGAAPVFLFQM